MRLLGEDVFREEGGGQNLGHLHHLNGGIKRKKWKSRPRRSYQITISKRGKQVRKCKKKNHCFACSFLSSLSNQHVLSGVPIMIIALWQGIKGNRREWEDMDLSLKWTLASFQGLVKVMVSHLRICRGRGQHDSGWPAHWIFGPFTTLAYVP